MCNWAEEWVAQELKEPPLDVFPFPSLKDTGSLCGWECCTCNPEAPSSSCAHWPLAGFVLGSPRFKSLATLTNSQLVHLLPAEGCCNNIVILISLFILSCWMHSVGARYYLVHTRSMKIVPLLWYKMACKSLPLHSFLSQLSCSLLYIVHNVTHPVYLCFIMTVLQITQLNSFYKYLSLEIREKNSQKCALLPIITKFGTQEIDRLSHLPG